MPRQQLRRGVDDGFRRLGLAAQLDDQAVGDPQIIGVTEILLYAL